MLDRRTFIVGAGATGLLAPAALRAKPGQVAVAMPDRISASVALAALERGNAVDAAVAVGFSLAVTYPEAGNIGGGGFATLWFDGKPSFLDFRETAPAGAHPKVYLEAEAAGAKRPSRVGSLAAGVPGTVRGLWELHQRHGTLPWSDLLGPAIALARDGFVVPRQLGELTEETCEEMGVKTNFARYFANVLAGNTFRQPDLARALERIAEAGPDGFYLGETAELIVAEMERSGGLISADDLAAYAAVWREPLREAWRGYEVLAPPPPSAGGIGLIQLLRGFDAVPGSDRLKLNSTEYVHVVAEMEKRVFADRFEHMGDPDFIDIPVETLISEAALGRRFAEISPDRLSPVGQHVRDVATDGNTTHFNIVDARGNAVALTYTVNEWFGSRQVVEGAGFVLNNEMDDFNTTPGKPNAYGVIDGLKNVVDARRRPVSSMTPTVVLKDGRVHAVAGSPGGPTILTSVYQALINVLHFGLGAREALDAPRFHHQLFPAQKIYYDGVFPLPPDVLEGLRSKGWALQVYEEGYGDPQLVLDGPRGLEAASMRGGWRRGTSVVRY